MLEDKTGENMIMSDNRHDLNSVLIFCTTHIFRELVHTFTVAVLFIFIASISCTV